ncbi:EAL domain-containing protein [Alkalimonas collagenimarina]|uniref:EAL domain-containing protein n=1 Tax=Alkalimonas collagenimarina TaxID=400390 RepID=A0ABT9H181_9GAMM|nr:EAL domain-containing protein [Alkalimonas collagenimarina]MDP4537076.1 EAL domain-containing protein [Alkalimonas collagenimarina]
MAKPVLSPLTPEQGLSQGTITNMMLDQDGFLWLATDGGLNRYDSTRVIKLSNQEQTLQDAAFVSTLQQADGSIWIATSTAGIYRFNAEQGWLEHQFSMPTVSEQTQFQHITDMIAYSEHQLLVSTNLAVFLLHTKTGEVSQLYQLSGENSIERFIRRIYQYNKHIFIGTHNQLLLLDLASNQVQSIPYLPADANNAQRHIKFFSVKDEHLWIGAVEGLHSLPLSSIATYLETGEPVNAQPRFAARNIWHVEWLEDEAIIATELGLYRFQPDYNHYQYLWSFSDSDLGLTDNNIISMVPDHSGGFWLGTRFDGAYYWHPRSTAFSHLGHGEDGTEAFSSLRVHVVAETKPHHLWVGTSNGLNRLDLRQGEIEPFLVNPDPKAIWHETTIFTLFPKTEHQVYFSSPYGLFLFDAKQNRLLPLPLQDESQQSLLEQGARYFWQDHTGTFWFAYDQHFYHYEPDTGIIQSVTGLEPLQPEVFGGFLGYLPGSNHQILLTTEGKIWLYNLSSEQLTLKYEASNAHPGLSRFADNILLDQQQRLWIGLNGVGLLVFNLPDFELLHHFHQHNQLESNLVFSLQQDRYGFIWFANHHGLFRMNPESFHTERFSKHDGLLTHEYNGRAGLQLQDGHLIYGGMRGITLIQPEQLLDEPDRPTAAITELSLLDGSFSTPYGLLNEQQFSLPHDAEGLKLHFSSMNFRDKNKVRFRVWLEGKQQFSFPEQTETQIIIPKLPAGDYIFHVVSVSPVTGEESAPARLRLSITPAWWASFWAYGLYTFMVLTIILLWLRNRQQHERVLAMAHRKVKASEQRLKLALSAVDSGAWEWLASKNSVFANRVHTMLGYREALNPLTLEQHVSLIHPEDKPAFLDSWQRFTEQQDINFDHTYRLQHKEGHWLWFRDIGKIAEVDSDEQVVRVVGTFSNITETRASQEKARLFGEAFQKTRDWVVILDAKQRVIAANQSFADAFGPVEHYMTNPQTHHLGISLDRRRYYTKLLNDFSVNQHWQGEELIVTPDGRERPTLINISAVGDNKKVGFFVLVFTDITDQKLAEDELRYLANYDALTGLPNRALLMDRIHHGIENAKRAKRALALCFIDLDKFKQINDSLGHDIGDLLLKEVARRLSLTLRESDTVARLGGDEFVVLLEGYKSHENINHVSRKMLQIIGEPMQLGPHTVGVSPSIGIAVYPDDAYTAFELLKHADVAMYHAKESGRNNFQFFTQEMNDKAHMQLAKETRLRKAFQQHEFVNYYQPIVHSADKTIVGVEVLLRWYSSDGVVSPAEFIPLAEDLSLIIPMTHALLERALADLQHWRSFDHQLYISVNLSARHLEHQSLAEQTASLLAKYQLPADCLRFEVTESALMRDHESAIATMHQLSELGIKLALDDFGTGYSSLKYLKELPINAIKIDHSFVKDIGIDQNDETIIETMLSMARSLGMYCVAEGVETEQQLKFFSQRECYLIQGYFFAQPMPSAQLLHLLQSKRFITQSANQL